MTLAGWILMIASNAFVLGLTAFCFYRVLSKPTSIDEERLPPTA